MTMAMDMVSTSDGGSQYHLVKVTPPQTNEAEIAVGKGAYCFVIDVSGSMNSPAQITTDDGDKVNHGWSQLDIAKHSTNTFVSCLSDDDWLSVVTYSDGANVLLEWTKCDDEGRDKAIAAIHSMRPERSTNLMAGITTGFSQFDSFPKDNASLPEYALNLIITTDGMPSSQWHPARGRDGYAPLVKTLSKGLAKKRGPAACPAVTSIGIGFQLDSELLTKMSNTFLHMPDPGQIGPFIVNLLAAVTTTARLPAPSGRAANACVLRVSPASAVVTDARGTPGVPGYQEPEQYSLENMGEHDELVIPLGSICYDQPRHVVLNTKPDVPFTASLVVTGEAIGAVTSADAPAADERQAKTLHVQHMRLVAIKALDEATHLGMGQDYMGVHSVIEAAVAQIRSSPHAADDSLTRLANTLESEGLLGAGCENYRKWGGHYFRTLPCMLRAERRSNFRDECLQHFGKDVRGREGLFESQSNMAEMRFATLSPPEPSLLNVPQHTSIGQPSMYAAAAPPPRPTALPDEFMRGGGCFAPEATVQRVGSDGAVHVVPVATVSAGDRVVADGGRLARVRCVVLTECAGGKAMLTKLPNGTLLTEWHPVREPSGRWRFPLMIGQRVLVRARYVYNLVLEHGHAAVLVGGIPCAALGHGLDLPVVAHPYWGTDAVIRDLMSRPGWAEGRVVLPATSAATSA